MPIGPNGEKRPRDVIANAVHVMRIATGEIEETYVEPPKNAESNGAAKVRKRRKIVIDLTPKPERVESPKA
ncbi:MAG: RNA-binding protein [Acidobacteriota bacterium]|nr:RNA-binding protein [Acidobacteriota bacterium]